MNSPSCRGVSTVGNVSDGVHAVEDCDSRLMSTSVILLSSGLSRSKSFIQPWKTLESALDQYTVANPNQSADSGNYQIVRSERPVTMKMEHRVIGHAGPRNLSDAKQAMSVYAIRRAGAIVPISLMRAELYLPGTSVFDP